MMHTKLLPLKESISFHLRNLALELRLVEGHTDYCRFIILGEGRSGSNFLRSLLNSHSKVIAFGELFRYYHSIGWDLTTYDQYCQPYNLLSLFQSNPIKFLEKKVFRKYPKQINAVGFKIFYYHAKEKPFDEVWTYLRDLRDLKVIHLKRNNTLKVILSLKKAFMTNKWEDNIGREDDDLAIFLDYDECLQRFIQARKYKEQYDEYFGQSQKIDVIYENLERDYLSEIKNVFGFLGIDYSPVKPSLFKQSKLPLSKAISNYFELKEKFKYTCWEEFFEE